MLLLSRVSHIREAEAPVDANSTRLDVSTVLVWCCRPGGFQTTAIFPSQDRWLASKSEGKWAKTKLPSPISFYLVATRSGHLYFWWVFPNSVIRKVSHRRAWWHGDLPVSWLQIQSGWQLRFAIHHCWFVRKGLRNQEKGRQSKYWSKVLFIVRLQCCPSAVYSHPQMPHSVFLLHGKWPEFEGNKTVQGEAPLQKYLFTCVWATRLLTLKQRQNGCIVF